MNKVTRNANGQYIYHATFWSKIKYHLKRVYHYGKLGTYGLTALAIAFYAGQFSSSQLTYTAPVEKIVVADSPVLERIGKCESPNGHLGKNGQVQVHANTNGTVDVGQYQINVQVWGAKATELGFDIFTKEGNEKMAEWLYANKGTEPWYSSKKCWAK